MSLRALSLLCAMATGLVAADGTSQLAPRSFDRLSPRQFQHFLSKPTPWNPMQLLEGTRRPESAPRICSIPLRELKVQPSRRFSMEILPVPKGGFDHIVGPNPAPACKDDEGK